MAFLDGGYDTAAVPAMRASPLRAEGWSAAAGLLTAGQPGPRSTDGSRAAPSGAVLVNDLAEAGRAEAREMAAMDHAHGQGAEPLHGREIVVAVRVIGVVDQRAVINDVAGKEDAGRALEQADAAGGMARRVDDLERSAAEVNDIAVLDRPAGAGGMR